jgi:TolA-binding protein
MCVIFLLPCKSLTIFVAFMQKSGKPVSYSEQDSLSFVVGQSAYNDRSYDNALKNFNNYLAKFPNGRYFIEANYMTADIYNTKKGFFARHNLLQHCYAKLA